MFEEFDLYPIVSKYGGLAVVVLLLVQLLFMIFGKFLEIRGSIKIIFGGDRDSSLNLNTKVASIKSILDAFISILLFYVLIPILAWAISFWHIPLVYITQRLLEWKMIGSVLIIILSVQTGLSPLGFIYPYLAFSTADNNELLLLTGFLPSFLSAVVYTLVKRRDLLNTRLK